MPERPHRKKGESGAFSGLSKLGSPTVYKYSEPERATLEAFPNRYPERDYAVTFEHPEFTSLCPLTGQPDFGLIRVRYVPGERCLESKSFKLYLTAFRDHGSFMESLTNKIAEDLQTLLSPRRLTVEGIFNARGGTRISVRVDYLDAALAPERLEALRGLW